MGNNLLCPMTYISPTPFGDYSPSSYFYQMYKVVIIDDEQPARLLISTYLASFKEFEVIRECSNGFEGLKAIQETEPDLIFLDIKMPKISGFEMLELLDDPPLTIFSTAFDDQAIKALEMNAIDYLLKPYTRERFDQALNKAIRIIQNNIEGTGKEIQDKISQIASSDEKLSRIVVKNGAQIEILPLTEISYMEAQDDYVSIHSTKGRHLKQITMKLLENQLPESDFLRVHRSYIIRLDQIRVIEPMTKDSFVAILKTGERISVSKKGYQLLKQQLKI